MLHDVIAMVVCWSQILSCYSSNATVVSAGIKHLLPRMGCLRVEISEKDRTTWGGEYEWFNVICFSPFSLRLLEELLVLHSNEEEGFVCLFWGFVLSFCWVFLKAM